MSPAQYKNELGGILGVVGDLRNEVALMRHFLDRFDQVLAALEHFFSKAAKRSGMSPAR